MEYQKVPLSCDPMLKGYSIDTNGILYSKFGRKMRPSVNHRGYLIQAFNIDGKMVARSMHQLVAKQFIPNPKRKRTVNHRNGDKQDNRVVNLEWATDSEQMQHASKVLHVLNPINKVPIVGLSVYSNKIITFPSIRDAASHFGIRRHAIYSVIHGRRLSSCGFFWIKALSSLEDSINKLQRIKSANLKRIKHKSRKVGMFSPINHLLKTYDNAYSTSDDGFCHQCVNKCCSGAPHYKTHKGYIWKYLE